MDFTTGTVQCDFCGEIHEAEFHHMGIHDPDTRYFEVTCTADYLTDYYAEFRVTPKEN